MLKETAEKEIERTRNMTREERQADYREKIKSREPLFGHTSPETAYVVEDYPYGFRERCQKRYWLEHKPKYGYRLVTQTSNPKKPGLVWNAPKLGNYHQFAVMVLDEDGHVMLHTVEPGGWTEEETLNTILETYGDNLTEADLRALRYVRATIRAGQKVKVVVGEEAKPQTKEEREAILKSALGQAYVEVKREGY